MDYKQLRNYMYSQDEYCNPKARTTVLEVYVYVMSFIVKFNKEMFRHRVQ